MGRHYSQLSMSERKRLQQSLNNDMSLRAVARGLWVGVFLPSAIECRSGGSRQDYDAVKAAPGHGHIGAVVHASCSQLVLWQSL